MKPIKGVDEITDGCIIKEFYETDSGNPEDSYLMFIFYNIRKEYHHEISLAGKAFVLVDKDYPVDIRYRKGHIMRIRINTSLEEFNKYYRILA